MGVWAVAGWGSGLEPFLVSENAIFFTPVQQGGSAIAFKYVLFVQ